MANKLFYQARKQIPDFHSQNGIAQQLPRPISPDYKIINLVAMGVLEIGESSLNLTQLEVVTKVKYPNRFPCAMFKVEGASILLFKNGKMIITGLQDPSKIPHVKLEVEEILERADYHYTHFTITFQNIVAMINLGQQIDLETVCITMENCIYEPEQFPAAVFRNYKGQGGVFLVFANSKITCLGLTDFDRLKSQFSAIVDELYDLKLIRKREFLD